MIIYVCSRFRAEVPETFMKYLTYTCEVSREIVVNGHDVIVPHLIYPNFLNDDIEEEREAGINSALRLMQVVDIMIINTQFGISAGMKAEIEHARKHDITTYTAKSIHELKTVLKEVKKIHLQDV